MATATAFTVNEELSGIQSGMGLQKFLVVLDGADQETITSPEAKRAVIDYAAAKGFTGAGMSDYPHPYPIDANTGKAVDDDNLLNPNISISGFRADYTLTRGI